MIDAIIHPPSLKRIRYDCVEFYFVFGAFKTNCKQENMKCITFSFITLKNFYEFNNYRHITFYGQNSTRKIVSFKKNYNKLSFYTK